MMSLQELAKNSRPLIDPVAAWAPLRENPQLEAKPSASLQCRQSENSPKLDVAMILMTESNAVQFRNECEKIKASVPVDYLKTAAASSSAWVTVQLGERKLLVRTARLKAALLTLGIP